MNSFYEELSSDSSSDEIMEDQTAAMEHVRQLSIRSAEVKDGLRKVIIKAFNRDVSDENIWGAASSGDESDDNRAKNTLDGDYKEVYSRSIRTGLRNLSPKCDQYDARTSHRRIEVNDDDSHYEELRKEKLRMKVKLTDRTIGSAEGSVEVDCTHRKSIFGQRNRAILIDIALKRRKEEEEAQLAAEKKNMMRKKFKDALLEKALIARNQPGVVIDDFVELGCKSEIRKSMNKFKTVGLQNSKSCALTLIEMEQQEKAEEDRRLEIAAVRRKFKAQHKNILLALMRKQEEKKAELMNLEEVEERKKKWKVMGENKKLGRRVGASLCPIVSVEEAKNAPTIRVKGRELKEDKNISNQAASSRGGSEVAVGSGLSSVRAHRAHTADTDVFPYR